MTQQFKLVIFGVIASLVATFSLIQPASAADIDEYGIYPSQLKAGQAAVIGLEIDDCNAAPTSLTVAIINGNDEVILTEANANFKSTLENDIYTASWTYTGANGKGVKAGRITADTQISGGCVGNSFEELDTDRFVQNSKATNLHGYIKTVEVNPSVDGVLVNWSAALGATNYEVRFSASGSNIWEEAGTTNETSFLIATEEFNLDYDTQYIAQVKPLYGQADGDWTQSNYWRGHVSRVEAWTSLISDETTTPVSEFESSSDIQFNFKIENCVDQSGLTSPDYFVNDLWPGTMDGGRGSSEIAYNDYGSTSFFSNYEFTSEGNTLLVSWRLTEDLPADTYKWGSYLIAASCVTEGWENVFNFPFSEYEQFSINEGGKTLPVVGGIDSIVKPSSTALRINWGTPLNSDDGPFTYRVYNTKFSEDQSDWVLLKKTNQRSVHLKNLKPETYLPITVKVSNSIGSEYFLIDGETLGYYAKTDSSMTLANLTKNLNYSKKVQKSLKLVSDKFFETANVCTVKKNNIKFSKKLGVCAVKISGKIAGEPFTKSIEIWSIK